MEQVMFDNLEGNEPRPEMFMKPVALFKDPFRRGRHKIVLMEFYKTLDTPCGKYNIKYNRGVDTHCAIGVIRIQNFGLKAVQDEHEKANTIISKHATKKMWIAFCF